MANLFTQPVKRYPQIDPGQFTAEHVVPGIPAIFTNIADGWQAKQKWTLSNLLNLLNAKHIRIDKKVGVHRGKYGHWTSQAMDLVSVLGKIQHREGQGIAPSANRYYLRAWRFWEELPELLEDFSTPSVFEDRVYNQIGQVNDYKWFFIGEAGTYTPTHLDYGYNGAWLYLVSGVKEWRFLQCPYFDEPAYFKQLATDEERCNPDQIEVFELSTIPKNYYSMNSWSALLQAGEIIWTPAQCLHGIRNVKTSFALTCNYINQTNAAISKYWPHDQKTSQVIDEL